MRVIAGAARRMALTAPKGQATRPTADRVKENLFNIIADEVPGARFLDLFCGSGAIGIEALSRGAAKAVFVDNARDAIAATQANLAHTRLVDKADVRLMCAVSAVSQLEREGREFDIIFLDPPYGSDLLNRTLESLGKNGILSPQGLLVVECPDDEPTPEAGPLVLYDTREYGAARLMFYRRNGLGDAV